MRELGFWQLPEYENSGSMVIGVFETVSATTPLTVTLYSRALSKTVFSRTDFPGIQCDRLVLVTSGGRKRDE